MIIFEFWFFGPIIKFSDEELAEIYEIIGVESVEWIKFPEKAKIKLSFVESAYKTKTWKNDGRHLLILSEKFFYPIARIGGVIVSIIVDKSEK